MESSDKLYFLRHCFAVALCLLFANMCEASSSSRQYFLNSFADKSFVLTAQEPEDPDDPSLDVVVEPEIIQKESLKFYQWWEKVIWEVIPTKAAMVIRLR